MVGSCLAAVGCGLIYMFNPGVLAGTWIGYQILTGFAFGLSFQTSIMAAQALAAYEDVATTTAILYCNLLYHEVNFTLEWQGLTHNSLPASRSSDFRINRRVHLLEHADLQSPENGSRSRTFTSHSRWRHRSTRSLPAGRAGWYHYKLYGWARRRFPAVGGFGLLRITGQFSCTVGEHQGQDRHSGCLMNGSPGMEVWVSTLGSIGVRSAKLRPWIKACPKTCLLRTGS
jgi:hypothetical protein